jgi:hypothetical protein
MTMHTQPVAACALPCVGPFVGAAPEDRHAERIVREIAFLGDLTKQTRPQLDGAMLRRSAARRKRRRDSSNGCRTPVLPPSSTSPRPTADAADFRFS